MKKFIALLLVISFMGMNCATYERGAGINLEPDQKPGVKLIIQKTDRLEIKGELIAVKGNSLLLKESGTDVSVDIKNVSVITILKKSKTLIRVGFGFLAGAALGMIVGLAVTPDYTGKSFVIWGPEQSALVGLAIGGLVGGVAGGLIRANRSETIQIEGRSDTVIKYTLEELRKKARVPDFQ